VHVAVTTPLQVPAHAVPSVAHAARGAVGFPLIALQTPTLPCTLQASHCPLHALSQHTPSTQLLLAQWLATVHAAPFAAAGMHVWPLQNLPVGHCASVVHVWQPGMLIAFWQPLAVQVSVVQAF
jgi:hypothetical protein